VASYNRVVIYKVQNSSNLSRQKRTANRVGDEMGGDVSNDTLSPLSPPSTQKEIIENNKNYLSAI